MKRRPFLTLQSLLRGLPSPHRIWHNYNECSSDGSCHVYSLGRRLVSMLPVLVLSYSPYRIFHELRRLPPLRPSTIFLKMINPFLPASPTEQQPQHIAFQDFHLKNQPSHILFDLSYHLTELVEELVILGHSSYAQDRRRPHPSDESSQPLKPFVPRQNHWIFILSRLVAFSHLLMNLIALKASSIFPSERKREKSSIAFLVASSHPSSPANSLNVLAITSLPTVFSPRISSSSNSD